MALARLLVHDLLKVLTFFALRGNHVVLVTFVSIWKFIKCLASNMNSDLQKILFHAKMRIENRSRRDGVSNRLMKLPYRGASSCLRDL